MSKLVPPHGGKGLVIRLLEGAAREAELKKAEGLKKVEITNQEKGDLIMIGIGGFSPLEGFMTKADWKGVCENFLMADGTFWPVPVMMTVSAEDGAAISEGDEITLENGGEVYGTMKVTEKFELSEDELKWECENVYKGEGEDSQGDFLKTALEDHPGVQMVMARKPVYLAGPVNVLSEGNYPTKYEGVYLRPAETRAIFDEKGWKTVAALQLRNPMHRSHEYLAKLAVETCDGVCIHSLIGNLKPGDIPAEVRVKCIDILVKNYFVEANVVQAGYPLDMRYAGPREGLLHAAFRQNYGINRMLIGRDHAGVGDFYGMFEAQEIFDRIPQPAEDGKRLLCEPMNIDWTFYCYKCDGMASLRTCPHDKEDRVILSGTKLRKALSEGADIPDHFGREEVLVELRKYYEGLTEKVEVKMQKAASGSTMGRIELEEGPPITLGRIAEDLDSWDYQHTDVNGNRFWGRVSGPRAMRLSDYLGEPEAPNGEAWSSEWLMAVGRIALKDDFPLADRVVVWNQIVEALVKEGRFAFVLGVYMQQRYSSPTMMGLGASEKFVAEAKKGARAAELRPGSDFDGEYDPKMPKKHLIAAEMPQIIDGVLAMQEGDKKTDTLVGLANVHMQIWSRLRNHPMSSYFQATFERWEAVADELEQCGRPDVAIALVWHLKDALHYYKESPKVKNRRKRISQRAGALIEDFPNCPKERKEGMRKYIEGSGYWDREIEGSLEIARRCIKDDENAEKIAQELGEAVENIRKRGKDPRQNDLEVNDESAYEWGRVWRGVERGEVQMDGQLRENWEFWQTMEPDDLQKRWERYKSISICGLPENIANQFALRAFKVWLEIFEKTHREKPVLGTQRDGWHGYEYDYQTVEVFRRVGEVDGGKTLTKAMREVQSHYAVWLIEILENTNSLGEIRRQNGFSEEREEPTFVRLYNSLGMTKGLLEAVNKKLGPAKKTQSSRASKRSAKKQPRPIAKKLGFKKIEDIKNKFQQMREFIDYVEKVSGGFARMQDHTHELAGELENCGSLKDQLGASSSKVERQLMTHLRGRAKNLMPKALKPKDLR